jgi:hypothetical protein
MEGVVLDLFIEQATSARFPFFILNFPGEKELYRETRMLIRESEFVI